MDEPILRVEESGEITIVRITERKLYQNTVAPFQDKMVSLVDSGRQNFIIDFSGVEVMNSSGLGVLILTWDRLNREGGKMVITGLGALMEELFQRMRLNLIFMLAETEEEAFRIIRGEKKIPAT